VERPPWYPVTKYIDINLKKLVSNEEITNISHKTLQMKRVATVRTKFSITKCSYSFIVDAAERNMKSNIKYIFLSL
jgi:hypothetical protein